MTSSEKSDDEIIKKHVERLKKEGKWTECHEHGHDIESMDNLICKRCGKDFNQLVEALESDIEMP